MGFLRNGSHNCGISTRSACVWFPETNCLCEGNKSTTLNVLRGARVRNGPFNSTRLRFSARLHTCTSGCGQFITGGCHLHRSIRSPNPRIYGQAPCFSLQQSPDRPHSCNPRGRYTQRVFEALSVKWLYEKVEGSRSKRRHTEGS